MESLKGTVVNRICNSFNKRSLEITLTVPLNAFFLGKYAEYLVTYHRKIQSVLRYFYIINLLFNVFSVCLGLNIKNNIFNIYLFLLFFSHAQLVKCEDLIFHTQVARTRKKT